MVRILLIVPGLVIIFQFFVLSSVFASSITLSNQSSSRINPADEYTVDAVLSIKARDGTGYYLRCAFFKEGDNDYCGYTWNGMEWYKGPVSSGEGWKSFMPVQISSDSASVRLKCKFDSTEKGCSTAGRYLFKIQRFTESGSASFDEQNYQELEVAVPTAIPTVIPSPVPSHTPKPTNTPKPPAPTKMKPTATSVSSVADISTAVPTFRTAMTSPADYFSAKENLLTDEFSTTKASVLGSVTGGEAGGVVGESDGDAFSATTDALQKSAGRYTAGIRFRESWNYFIGALLFFIASFVFRRKINKQQ